MSSTTTVDIEYFVVSGTLAAMAAFNTAVNAAVDAGYAPLVEPHTDGTGIWQIMVKGGAASFISTYAITAVATGLGGTFTVAGDETLNFQPGYKFTITGSTNNDGIWTVVSSTYGATTVITVEETVGAVADGVIVGYAPSVGP